MSESKWNVLYFEEWVKKEGLDLIRGHKVEDVFTQPLKPWARTGGKAVQIQLEGTGELNASYMLKSIFQAECAKRGTPVNMESGRTSKDSQRSSDMPLGAGAPLIYEGRVVN